MIEYDWERITAWGKGAIEFDTEAGTIIYHHSEPDHDLRMRICKMHVLDGVDMI